MSPGVKRELTRLDNEVKKAHEVISTLLERIEQLEIRKVGRPKKDESAASD